MIFFPKVMSANESQIMTDELFRYKYTHKNTDTGI